MVINEVIDLVHVGC